MRISKLRAHEAAYRRACIVGYSPTYAPRLFPARLVTWFWWVVVGVVMLTAADFSFHATPIAQAIAKAWRNW